jgi:hypothetical protein
MAVRVYLDDPDMAQEDAMQFRLTYEGPLLADNNRAPGRAPEKQRIRKHFHKQLKRAWRTHPVLNFQNSPDVVTTGQAEVLTHDEITLSNRFTRNGYRFVPIATRELGALVGLDILFLRADPPGSVLYAGDIDNRVKTLVDALRMPRELAELGPFTTPSEGEDPFYVLMEDDSLVARLSVDTDTLLEPVEGKASDARVIVTVRVSPYRTTIHNVHFGG